MLHRAPLTKPLHVLVATPVAAMGQGGIDRVMASLRDELARSEADSVEVEFRASRGAGHVALSPFFLGTFLLRLVTLRLAGKLDLVHINLSSEGSTYRKLQIARVCRWLGIPYLLHLHGGDYMTFWKADNSRLSRSILEMFEGAARIVVLGSTWRRFVASRLHDGEERVVVVPNASAPPDLPHVGGGETVHLLFLGRIGQMKGVPQLGEALFRMRDLPGWRATIAGDGDVEAARAKAVEYGLADRVELPGWVDSQRVHELIATADVLVLPSFTENLPLSIIEGMASGLAVVATPVGAVEDIVHDGETGLIVQPGDVDGLTTAMTRLVRDRDLRIRMGAAGQRLHRERLELAPYARAMQQVWLDAAH